MGRRVTPSERLRHELDTLIGDAGELGDPIEQIGRLGARLIIQQALEEVVPVGVELEVAVLPPSSAPDGSV